MDTCHFFIWKVNLGLLLYFWGAPICLRNEMDTSSMNYLKLLQVWSHWPQIWWLCNHFIDWIKGYFQKSIDLLYLALHPYHNILAPPLIFQKEDWRSPMYQTFSASAIFPLQNFSWIRHLLVPSTEKSPKKIFISSSKWGWTFTN